MNIRMSILFVSLAACAAPATIETRNIIDGFSEDDGPAWDSPDAELHICRRLYRWA